ncbi:Uma2 family endonuclease [Streptomyces sp. NBC_00457]|uniref:Uma2 family endonuclease n=1 Tax=unclassified Streptomyces TaxID=2593676 RepID=UPI002E1D5291|nr:MULTISPECIES: Uma2 family endonuclease [unclassified Streptomyces]
MSAASVEQPQDDRPLIAEANRVMERLRGQRVEIIEGLIVVTPLPDLGHARALKKLARPFEVAGLDEDETEVHQGIGVWLPDGPEDYAIPDLCVVDADIDDQLIENNCYDPAAFRLVLEVTSSNWQADLRAKVKAYAQAKIPVYVIVNRKHQRLHVLTDPAGDTYENHRPYVPGEIATLPDTLGAKVTLDVDEILKAGQPRAN